MNIRGLMRTGPNAGRAVKVLVVSAGKEMIEGKKAAFFVGQDLLSIDLLETDHVGRKRSHDWLENAHSDCELCFMAARPIKIFEIESRKAKRNGHLGRAFSCNSHNERIIAANFTKEHWSTRFVLS